MILLWFYRKASLDKVGIEETAANFKFKMSKLFWKNN